MARSIAAIVGCKRLPAAVASFAVIAVRRRRIMVRTRVRLARLTSARSRDCCARLSTDFFRFLTFVAAPCAIYRSLSVLLKQLTLNEGTNLVKRRRGILANLSCKTGSLYLAFGADSTAAFLMACSTASLAMTPLREWSV